MEEGPWAGHQEKLPFTIAVLQLEKPCDALHASWCPGFPNERRREPLRRFRESLIRRAAVHESDRIICAVLWTAAVVVAGPPRLLVAAGDADLPQSALQRSQQASCALPTGAGMSSSDRRQVNIHSEKPDRARFVRSERVVPEKGMRDRWRPNTFVSVERHTRFSLVITSIRLARHVHLRSATTLRPSPRWKRPRACVRGQHVACRDGPLHMDRLRRTSSLVSGAVTCGYGIFNDLSCPPARQRLRRCGFGASATGSDEGSYGQKRATRASTLLLVRPVLCRRALAC